MVLVLYIALWESMFRQRYVLLQNVRFHMGYFTFFQSNIPFKLCMFFLHCLSPKRRTHI